MRSLLKSVVENAYLNLGIGFAVLVSGVTESVTQFTESGFELGAHHGMVVLGLFHTMKSLADVFDGLERFENVETRDLTTGGETPPVPDAHSVPAPTDFMSAWRKT
jgi:hypothetical protein